MHKVQPYPKSTRIDIFEQKICKNPNDDHGYEGIEHLIKRY